MAHDSRSVANEMIRRALNRGESVTHLKVQKLVYLCEAWMLGIHGTSIIRQDIVAWRYGPVIIDVYHSLKGYGARPIPLTIQGIQERDYNKTEESILDQVSMVYASVSGGQLSALTHQRGTPWHITRSRWGENAIIPKSLIQDFYRKKYEAQEQ